VHDRQVRWLALMIVLVSRGASAEPTNDSVPTSLVVVGDSVGAAAIAGGYAVLRLSSGRNCDMCAGEVGMLMMGVGATWYLGFAPMAHHERGHDGRAWFSGALRLGLPLAAGLGSAELTHREGPIVGAVGASMVAAMVFDWTVLAHEPRIKATMFGAPIAHGALIGVAKTW
jgi:hypothetical protein